MRQLTSEEIKQRQLEILKYLKSVCEENNIRYSLGYGTLLGAVRHKGYIPWDDDIDVCVPRKDYDKLCAILREKKGRFFLLDTISDDDYYNNFAKLMDGETHVDRKFVPKVKNYGLWVDIFPLDNCTDSERSLKWNRWFLFHDVLYIHFILREGKPQGMSKAGTFVLQIVKFIVSLFGFRFWRKRHLKRIQKFNKKETGYMIPWQLAHKITEIIPKWQYENMGKIRFEDDEFSCLADPHQYLTNLYGDYMQFPPVEQRVGKHNYVAYLKED